MSPRSARRRWLHATGAAAAAGLLPVGLQAQAPSAGSGFPSRTVRFLVGYSAGGAVDLVARAVAAPLSAALGQAVVVENRPGGATNIAVRALIDSPPDGHTLMLAANALAANPTLFQPPPFDLARDLTPVSLVGRVPVVLAVAVASPLQSLAQLIDAARTRRGAITYGTPGNGATPHLAVELFERAAGISLRHVPYKGGSQAITDTLGGHIDLVAVNALEVLPHVRGGRLRVLAALSPARSALLPEVPTIAESGFPGFEASVWYGFIAPAATPRPVIERLHAEIQKALQTTEVRERLASAGGEVLPGSIAQFASLLESERLRYQKLIREAGIKPD